MDYYYPEVLLSSFLFLIYIIYILCGAMYEDLGNYNSEFYFVSVLP